jgi:hypothetical protein
VKVDDYPMHVVVHGVPLADEHMMAFSSVLGASNVGDCGRNGGRA